MGIAPPPLKRHPGHRPGPRVDFSKLDRWMASRWKDSDGADVLERVGKNIRRLRRERGLDLRVVCMRIGWSVSSRTNLYQIEEGKKSLSIALAKRPSDAIEARCDAWREGYAAGQAEARARDIEILQGHAGNNRAVRLLRIEQARRNGRTNDG